MQPVVQWKEVGDSCILREYTYQHQGVGSGGVLTILRESYSEPEQTQCVGNPFAALRFATACLVNLQ